MEAVSKVFTARVRVWPFQLKIAGATPPEVEILSSSVTTSTFAPEVTVKGTLKLVDVVGLLVMPTGPSCRAIAARADMGNDIMVRPQRENAAENGRAQFKTSLDRILIGLICRDFIFTTEASGWVLG